MRTELNGSVFPNQERDADGGGAAALVEGVLGDEGLGLGEEAAEEGHAVLAHAFELPVPEDPATEGGGGEGGEVGEGGGVGVLEGALALEAGQAPLLVVDGARGDGLEGGRGGLGGG